ncbi:MAG: hypothetical protein SGPRY_003262 [Prymnesium sp.]
MALTACFLMLLASVLANGGLPCIPPKERGKASLIATQPSSHHSEPTLLISLPRALDSILAALGAAVSIFVLDWMEKPLGVKVYSGPLAPCALLIFAGERPPPIRNLLLGTIGPVLAAMLIRAMGGSGLMGRCVAIGLSLLWFKSVSVFFPPAAGFSVILVDTLPVLSRNWLAKNGIANFVPAVVGVSSLYLISVLVASLRDAVRVRLALSDIRRSMLTSDCSKKLRKEFLRFDISGDRNLDPLELKLALVSLTGVSLSIETCMCETL